MIFSEKFLECANVAWQEKVILDFTLSSHALHRLPWNELNICKGSNQIVWKFAIMIKVKGKRSRVTRTSLAL